MAKKKAAPRTRMRKQPEQLALKQGDIIECGMLARMWGTTRQTVREHVRDNFKHVKIGQNILIKYEWISEGMERTARQPRHPDGAQQAR